MSLDSETKFGDSGGESETDFASTEPVTPRRFDWREELPAVAMSLASVLLLFSICRGPLIFWEREGYGLVPSGTYLSLVSLGLFTLGFAARLILGGSKMLSLYPWAFGLLLVAGSDWICHPYNFFQGPSIRGEILCAGVLAFLLLKVNFRWALSIAGIFGAAILFWNFLEESGGRVLFSDDHASVFYRLTLLQAHFPDIPFYNPLWNAGSDARDFFSTGILNLYFLSFPLLHWFRLEEVYNLIIGGVLFLLLPGSVYFAVRYFGLERASAGYAAGLSLAIGLPWYRWALKYGSMGFITSAALIPLNLALAAKVLSTDEELNLFDAILLTITFSLMLCWTPTGLIFIPVVLLSLAAARRLWKKRYAKQILLGVLLLTIPWMIVWIRVAQVWKFVATPSPSATEQHQAAEERLSRDDESATYEAPSLTPKKDRRKGKGESRAITPALVLKSIRTFSMNSNPLILFLGLPGLFLLNRKRHTFLLGLTAAWLFTLGCFIAPLKPQLELDRMLVVLMIVLCIPAGLSLRRLVNDCTQTRSFFPRVLGSTALAFYLVGMACATGIIRNRSLEQYYFADDTVGGMAAAIYQYGGNGRTLFSGFVLHELDHGHLSPLAYYTKRPLIASSPVHNTWWYTDVIPQYYRDTGPAAIEQYLDAMNVSSVMAHEPFWRTYFGTQPELYTQVWEGGKFNLFQRVSNSGSYFLEGSGEMSEQTTNSVSFRVDGTEAVVKFHYYPFLKSSACNIEPFELPGKVELVKLTNCNPGETVTISSKGALRRVVS